MAHPPLGVDEIDRKYEVLEKLGEGGMGAVYKVRHRLLEELRVIKLIRAELEGRDELQARFLREAKVATQLRHRNIAQMFDFSVGDDGTAYIVMEFIDGDNLGELLDRAGKLPLAVAVELASQSLAALGYLHDKQVVHRDIAPDNIMIAREGGRTLVKLIDLGIAKPLESTQSHTRAGSFVGKVRYASPEAFSGSPARPVEARSDLYSFGLVLYEALTGHFAVNGDNHVSVMAGHLFEPPRSFEDTDPDHAVPEAVRAVILKALEKSADERFASAEEFRLALFEAAGEVPEDVDDSIFDAVTQFPKGPAAPATTQRETHVEPTQIVGDSRGIGAWVGRARSLVSARRGAALLTAGGLALAAVAGWWLVGADRDRPPAISGAAERTGGARGDGAAALAALDYGRYHALVIGNNAYQQLPRLETAAVDATEFARLLEEKYGFEVTLLVDADRYATLTALTDITESLTAADNLLIYYAGHGWLDTKSESGYWQPIDAEPFNSANWISTKYEISALLADLPARQVLVVADSCYSGAISQAIDPVAAVDLPPSEYAEHVRELLGRRSRLALTSGGLSPVLDVGDGRHSVFSKVLLEILGANDQVIETSRLFGALKDRVASAAARFGAEQDPQLAPIPQIGDEGGEFFFVPTPVSG